MLAAVTVSSAPGRGGAGRGGAEAGMRLGLVRPAVIVACRVMLPSAPLGHAVNKSRQNIARHDYGVEGEGEGLVLMTAENPSMRRPFRQRRLGNVLVSNPSSIDLS